MIYKLTSVWSQCARSVVHPVGVVVPNYSRPEMENTHTYNFISSLRNKKKTLPYTQDYDRGALAMIVILKDP